MPSVNKVTLLGRLGKNAEIKITNSGKSVANLSIATSYSWKDPTDPINWIKKTEWHYVSVFKDGLIGYISRNIKEGLLNKGENLYIEGHLSTTSYTGTDGNKKTATNIIASTLFIVGNKTKNSEQPAPTSKPFEADNDDEIPF